MIKKAKEFTVLCDVHTAMIILPPDSNEPGIWPESNPGVINKAIGLYKTSEKKTTYDLNDYFEDRKNKIEEKLMKARKENTEKLDEFNAYPEAQLRLLAKHLEDREHKVRAVLELKKTKPMDSGLPTVIGVKSVSPGKSSFKVESFVSEEYKDLVEWAALR